MSFEIWWRRGSGERYLVVVRDGTVWVAAGPLAAHADPRAILARHGNQHHNVSALMDMRRTPGHYLREDTSNVPGEVVALPDVPG